MNIKQSNSVELFGNIDDRSLLFFYDKSILTNVES
jgi:hypothetical protein